MTETYDETVFDDFETDADLIDEPAPRCPLCGATDGVLQYWRQLGGNSTVKRIFKCSCGTGYTTGESVNRDDPIHLGEDAGRLLLEDRLQRRRLAGAKYLFRLDALTTLVYDRTGVRVGGHGTWSAFLRAGINSWYRAATVIGPADDFEDDNPTYFSFERALASRRIADMRDLAMYRVAEKQKVAQAIRQRRARLAGLAAPLDAI